MSSDHHSRLSVTVVPTPNWVLCLQKGVPMTVSESRSIPSRLAPVLEALELDQPRVVTADSLAQLARDQRAVSYTHLTLPTSDLV